MPNSFDLWASWRNFVFAHNSLSPLCCAVPTFWAISAVKPGEN